MTILTYFISFGAFCFAAWWLPTLLFWAVKQGMQSVDYQSHYWAATALFAVCGLGLLALTDTLWRELGFELGWLFPAIIAVSHFLWAHAPEASVTSKAQGYGVCLAAVAFGLFKLVA